MNRLHVPAVWPFDVRILPFYYGWVIWLLSTIGYLMTIPGQTMGMAVYTDAFIEAFGLGRTELASAYFFGTTASATLLVHAGRLYDRIGARLMIVAASLLLGLALLWITRIEAWIPHLRALGLPAFWAAFPLILVGYFGVRFAGQGVLMSACGNVLLAWFERRRGLVSSVRSTVVSLGFSIAPQILAALILFWGWSGSLWVLAAVVGIAFPLLALAFVRDRPEDCGLVIDGGAGPQTGPAAAATSGTEVADTTPAPVPDRTGAQAQRDPVFWFYAALLSYQSCFGTALVFHITALFGEAGRSNEEAYAYFLPQAIASLATNLTVGLFVDRLTLRPLVALLLLGYLLGAGALLILDTTLGYWLLVCGMGASGGLWVNLSNLAFVRHFGLKHLGEITGTNASVMVFTSAVGPLLFALIADASGSWRAAAWSGIAAASVLVVAAVMLQRRFR